MLTCRSALFFLLYFNRVIASLASWALRTWTWHRYGIYIDIQAIQFSLLGGRIFFVGLRYHGNNETILVQNGHITWSYWLRRVRHINLGKRRTGKDVADDELDGNKVLQDSKTKPRLPCRLNVNVSGVEWFVYNRSAAYDSIVAGLADMDAHSGDDDAPPSMPNEDQPQPQQGDDPQHKLRKRRANNNSDDGGKQDDSQGFFRAKLAQFEAAANRKRMPVPSDADSSSDVESEQRNTRTGASRRNSGAEYSENTALPAFLQLFPIHFICDRAALVMGNENTSAILVFKTQTLSGEIDAKHTPTPDPYRQVFRFHFQKPVMEFRDNDDYREDQTTRAVRERQIAEDTEPLSPRSFFRRHRRTVYSQLRNLVPYFRSSVESFSSPDPRSPPATAAFARIPGSAHWQGLSRYLDGPGGDEKTRWISSEYAMLNPILESPEAFLTLYWDSVGRVAASAVAGSGEPESPAGQGSEKANTNTNINGSEPPPAWGMAFSIRGGDINYGPWADRKRAELQRVFFPSLSKDAKPAQRLPAGAYRAPTQFKVYVELDDEVTMRVPLRESSKNWRYKGKEMGTKFQSARDKKRNRSRFKKSEPAQSAASQRPYGWLDIKIASNATVSYTMDMVASASGFTAKLDLDLPRVEISSSVNQQVLWRSGALRTSCDLSTPLQWNALRQWRFHITGNDLELFLLRDHVFLLTDLIDDWGTGPPAEYLVFTPFRYHIDLSFPNAKIFLNVNDANIINDPTSFDDNTFIILASTLLEASVCIPLDKFRPPSNAIPFSVRTDMTTFRLHVPSWSTQHMFVRDKTLGHIKSLLLEGKYDYHAVTAPGNSDTLVLNVSGKRPVFNAYGFVVRYFLKLKDNYFGDDVHFKTLEEYQDGLRLKQDDPDADLASRPPHKASNDMDVILNVFAEDPRILLPAYIYSTSRLVQIDMANLAADLRFTNYYMDLDVVLPPLSLSLEVEKEGNHDNGDWDDHPVGSVSNTQLFIDGLHVYGSRLFGLPPTEPTYLCNWDCSVGAVTGECTADFLTALANGGKAFGFTFDDDENALIPYHTIVMYDVTFLRANVKSVAIWLHVDEAAFLLSLDQGIDVCYNDWARQHYSKRGDISIPDLQVSCVNSESAMRHKSRPSALVETDAFLKTGLDIAIIGRKNDFSNERALQQALIRREDQRTQRAAFLIIPGLMDRTFIPDHVDPPAQPVPPIPLPVSADDVARDGISLSSGAASVSSKRRLRRQKSQRSFLSASASSQSSVVRPQSSVHTGSARSRQSSMLPLGRQGTQRLAPMGSHHEGKLARAPSATSREAAPSRQSALSNIMDYATDSHRHGPSHNTMAFSSKYFAPYFPLENVAPDISEAMCHGSNGVNCFGSHVSDGAKANDAESDADDMSFADFGLDDVDPASLNEDRMHASMMVRVRDGVSAFFNPASAKHIAALISALQPRDPDDILDKVQIAAVDGIIGAMNRRSMQGRMDDIAVQLPRANLRFLNAMSPDAATEEQDQYDVTISNVTFMSREKTTWHNAMKPEENVQHNSFQLRLGSLELTASERAAHIRRPQAAFMATVENVLVSMGTKDLAYLDADIKSVDGQLSSEKIEYIASLVHRTGVLASELGEAFAVPLSHDSKVRAHLAQRLIAAGSDGVTDPGFLVRPSAVLRSAHEHLRTYDSWKVAMRLRQIWFLMKKEHKEQIICECRGHAPLLPLRESPMPKLVVAPIGGTVREVITKLEYWRGWDLGDLTRTLFLQEMFSSLKADMHKVAAARRPVPAFLAVGRVDRLQFALDPGPKQNEVTVLDLTVRFENSAAAAVVVSPPPSRPAAAPGINPMKPTSILNVYCSESAVRLNWEICELAEDVIRLFKKHAYEKSMAANGPREHKAAAPTAASDGKTAGPKNAKNAKPVALVDQSTLHVVFAMDQGSVILDTINLHAHMRSQGTKSSLLLRHTPDQILDTNFITSCDFISSKVKSHSEVVFWSELQRPSVFIAHGLQTTRSNYEHTIKATASSRNFLFSMKQDPLALVETLDLLVKDEVRQLYQLSELFPLAPDTVRTASASATSVPAKAKAKEGNAKIAQRLSAVTFNVALFLEEYTISLPLLRSLAYTISGVVARVAVAATYGKEVIFDFDVKENSHDMQVTVNNTPRSISLLQIPPTNGRITTRMGEHEQTVSVFSSVELVQLDAAAVYSLLSALNRPEISNTIADMQQQLKAVQRHVKEIFGATSQPPAGPLQEAQALAKNKPARPVIYSVHSTFAGLEIFSDVSLKSDPEPLAHLLFKLGSVQLEMTNRLDNRGPVLAYPELHINTRQTTFEILKGSEAQMTSCGSMTFAALITASSKVGEDGKERRLFDVKSDSFDVSLSPETVSTVVDVLGYMGDKIKDLDTSREMEYLRKLRQSKPRIAINDEEQPEDDDEAPDIIDSFLSSIAYTFEIRSIQVNWLCAQTAQTAQTAETTIPSGAESPVEAKEDLVLTLQRIEFGTRTKNSARLTIENLQLQMVPPAHDKKARSANSALLPEVVFNVAYFSTASSRRFAFQAVGKSLDLRLTSEFIVPAAHLKDSIQLSIKNVQQVSRRWNPVASAPNTNTKSFTTGSGTGSPSKPPGSQKQPMFGNKRLESFLVDVDFAGAVVYISGMKNGSSTHPYGTPASGSGASGSAPGVGPGSSRPRRSGIGGKYGQFTSDESGGTTILRSPGLAWKMEYRDTGRGDPSLYAEVKINPSSNVLYPSVVPLVMDLTASIQEVVSKSGKDDTDPGLIEDSPGRDDKQGGGEGEDAAAKLKPEESILLSAANPNAMLGRLKLNLGIRIHKQQFTLSCQPIARVTATTSFDDVYLTMNTIQTVEHGNFVAISGNITRLQASVQHVYSRESTGSFEVESIVLSLMNSKHVSGVSGVSALLKVSPMKVAINVRQVQDFLLFQEIWTPRDIRKATTAPIVTKAPAEAAPSFTASQPQTQQTQQTVHLAQRYQQVAATAAFPWTASISIAALEINVDLGQALGKSIFAIEEFWVSSKKTSDWEQNLCLGFRRIGIDSTGRMSGFVALEDFKLRTSIEWPQREQALSKTPLIQASISFSQLRVKASFDYQAFLVADVRSMNFLMYNIRRGKQDRGDRLVAVFEGDAVQVFGTTTSAAQAVALYQAFLRLVQERKANFETSLREIERFTNRRSSAAVTHAQTGVASSAGAATVVAMESAAGLTPAARGGGDDDILSKSPISLDTDVVVTLQAVNLGVFPNTFADHQVFKMEALNAQARFAANIHEGRIHSNLGLTLGQLRIGLAGVRNIPTKSTAPGGPPKSIGELSVDDVVLSATGSRGGTILKVPRVEAGMQTWQTPDSRQIDYIFRSAFEGKVEVGWNYSRISYIRGMWANHNRTFEQTWGRGIALAAIRVTGVPESANDAAAAGGDGTFAGKTPGDDKQAKITAEVHVPQSRFQYNALQPAVIETPQLRDMGEATPPLEWIGLHRDRLPNLTHQIVIVSLLELAGEVEDAYARILGSS